MKRKLKLLVVAVVITFIMSGCNSNSDKSKVKNLNLLEDIMLQFKENTLSLNGVVIEIINSSNQSITYGSEYFLEVKRNGEWFVTPYIVGGNYGNTDMEYLLNANRTVEMEIKWIDSHGELSTGDYRLLKHVTPRNADRTDEDYYVGVELTIE